MAPEAKKALKKESPDLLAMVACLTTGEALPAQDIINMQIQLAILRRLERISEHLHAIRKGV